ncbi:MAG: peptide-methionine (S)-S-oxide reductase MsrA [Muribaculaceae bacterium]|nr:peptide-methionine (S)-S-oxide reductase MsrA [Muribaculaceae bacterium]
MIKEIYLAGGCFWGTQHFLKQINGVVSTSVGYANGTVPNPTYNEVYTDKTGHVETVRVCYDSDVVSLEMILDLYFQTIDPTSLDQQGPDIGTRYRTGIYYTDADDVDVIRNVTKRIALQYIQPIVVEIERLECFYLAEDYHQDYLDKNPGGYCHIPRSMFALAKNANRGND